MKKILIGLILVFSVSFGLYGDANSDACAVDPGNTAACAAACTADASNNQACCAIDPTNAAACSAACGVDTSNNQACSVTCNLDEKNRQACSAVCNATRDHKACKNACKACDDATTGDNKAWKSHCKADVNYKYACKITCLAKDSDYTDKACKDTCNADHSNTHACAAACTADNNSDNDSSNNGTSAACRRVRDHSGSGFGGNMPSLFGGGAHETSPATACLGNPSNGQACSAACAADPSNKQACDAVCVIDPSNGPVCSAACAADSNNKQACCAANPNNAAVCSAACTADPSNSQACSAACAADPTNNQACCVADPTNNQACCAVDPSNSKACCAADPIGNGGACSSACNADNGNHQACKAACDNNHENTFCKLSCDEDYTWSDGESKCVYTGTGYGSLYDSDPNVASCHTFIQSRTNSNGPGKDSCFSIFKKCNMTDRIDYCRVSASIIQSYSDSLVTIDNAKGFWDYSQKSDEILADDMNSYLNAALCRNSGSCDLKTEICRIDSSICYVAPADNVNCDRLETFHVSGVAPGASLQGLDVTKSIKLECPNNFMEFDSDADALVGDIINALAQTKKLDFTGVNLKDANLAGLDFSKNGVVFKGSDLTNVDLRGTKFPASDPVDFTGATLIGAHLEGVEFNNCDFTGALFTGAFLNGAKFLNSTFSKMAGVSGDSNITAGLEAVVNTGSVEPTMVGVKFDGSKMPEMDFRGMTFQDVSFKNVDFSVLDSDGNIISGTVDDEDMVTGGASFINVKFSGVVDVTGTKFGGAVFDGATFNNNIEMIMTEPSHLPSFAKVSFAGVSLKPVCKYFNRSSGGGGSFVGLDFTGAKFINTDLTGCDLSNIKGGTLTSDSSASVINAFKGKGIDFNGAKVKDTKFNGANLSGAINLGKLIISGPVNFSGANLIAADLSGNSDNTSEYHSSNFTNANLTSAVIDYTNFGYASNSLKNVNWKDVVFNNVNLQGVDTSGAQNMKLWIFCRAKKGDGTEISYSSGGQCPNPVNNCAYYDSDKEQHLTPPIYNNENDCMNNNVSNVGNSGHYCCYIDKCYDKFKYKTLGGHATVPFTCKTPITH